MDESALRYYMRVPMRLLLLLSAFLTAMVGVGTPATAAPRAACEVTASSSATTARQAPQRVALPVAAPGVLDSVTLDTAAPTPAPSRTVPLYAGRLRV